MKQSSFNLNFAFDKELAEAEKKGKQKKKKRSKKQVTDSRSARDNITLEPADPLVSFEDGISDEILDEEEESGTDKTPHIYTITEITTEIRDILETRYPEIWVTGEVSNLRNPAARNYYFVLKDETCQIRAVLFGGRQRLSFDLEDGLEVICHGKVGVYGSRGDYQIIIDYCEPKGKGALQLAFEQLKKKLETEGLFNLERKRKLPFLPQKIGVITSPTGAAIRDIINVLTRRYPLIEILLYPVKVQGDGAAEEIAHAIQEMNKRDDINVLIVGRGGGSLEDLWAFNEEVVARAIFASRIPIVSAVGHQIDFTISDFVADVRAATPSAAAEIVVPKLSELLENIAGFRRQLMLAIKQRLQSLWLETQRIRGRLSDPSKRFPDLHMRIDGLSERIKFIIDSQIREKDQHLNKLLSNLNHLSPKHIMEKGYAVVTMPNKEGAVKSSKSLKKGDNINIKFYEGSTDAEVK